MDRKQRLYSRGEVENLIAEGRSIIIHNSRVLKCDPWLKFHPGGDKAIMHMIGRDATDEVNALHSPEALQRMKAYQIGRIEGRWKNFIPPIQGGHFRTLKVQEMEQQQATLEDMDNAKDADSSSDSAASSPLFEPADSLRRRRGENQPSSTRSSSATSLSSMELDIKHTTKPTSLDAQTQQEIDFDLAKYPSLEPAVQEDIVQKYRQLNERMKAEGLYQCNYWAYGIEVCRYTFLFAMSMLFLRWGWYGTSGLFLGMMWHQLVFAVHDAAHMGITHNFHIDTVLSIIGADFIGGLSAGWWKRNHNVHHIVTNSPEHDPDIEHIPFFAISHRFFESLRSTYHDRIMTYDSFAKFTLRYQHLLYYPILTMGRFNLYALSWGHLLSGSDRRSGPGWWHRYLEMVGHIFFWYWFGYGLVYKSIPTWGNRILFVMVSHMITGPVHVQITLSHFAMSTADLGPDESFPQRMLRTTMDVDCPPWLDFFHGGLQFQAIHHLYPRMPRHNLRRAQKLVQEFCEDVDIPYALYGFVDGNKEVISKLEDVARQARILAECQKVVARNPWNLDAH